jgi:hypothetical protein
MEAIEDSRRHTRRGAVEFLASHGYPVGYATLERLAVVGGGPVFVHFGRKPLYAEADLLAWAQSRCSGPKRSTSDNSSALGA